MSTLDEIGKAVRVRRTEMGLTQALLARLIELSRSTVNAVENGSIANLSIAKAVALLESIGLSMNVNLNAARSSSRKNAPPSRSAMERAAATASISYGQAMTAKQLQVGVFSHGGGPPPAA